MLSRAETGSILEAGILAPSADNRHMLRFRVDSGAILIRADAAFAQAPFHRRVLALISLGAVVENMALRAGALGFVARVAWPDGGSVGGSLAELRFERVRPQPSALEAAIALRHTNRRLLYRGPALAPDQRRQLADDAGAVDGVRLLWLDAPPVRRAALRLAAIAEAERFRSRPLHADLFSSIRFDLDWRTTAAEGLPPGALEIEPPMRPLFKALRHWNAMRVLARLGAHRVIALRAAYLPCRLAPHVCALVTRLRLEDGAVAAGRALERVWLRATALGLAFQPLAGAALLALDGYRDVEEDVRRRLATGWSGLCADALPLMLFRIGHARPPTLRTARPRLGDLVDEPAG
jgi:hypothetical protein